MAVNVFTAKKKVSVYNVEKIHLNLGMMILYEHVEANETYYHQWVERFP
jgi:hypothetical protein